MIEDKTKAWAVSANLDDIVQAANLEDIIQMLELAGKRAVEILRNGEIDFARPEQVDLLPARMVQQLVDEELLITIGQAVERIDCLNSEPAVSRAIKSTRTPLAHVLVGRSYYLTDAWLREWDAKRFFGRTPKD